MTKVKICTRKKYINILDEERYVHRVVHANTITEDEIVSYASRSAGIPESTFVAATLAIRQSIVYFVCNGHRVDLGRFGIMGMKISTPSLSPTSVRCDIKGVRLGIAYLPSVELKDLVDEVELCLESDRKEEEQ